MPARCGPAGDHDPRGRDRAARRLDRRHPAAAGPQPREGRVLDDVHTRGEQRSRVGEHVERRLDVAVTGGVRRAHRQPGRHRRVRGVHLVGPGPAHVEPERLLHGDARVRRLDVGLGEAGHVVPLLDEAGVDAQEAVLAVVEVAAEQTESYGGLGAALGSHHARGADAGAVAEPVRLDEHDVVEPGPSEEPRRPGPDRAASDHDGVGRSGTGRSSELVTSATLA